MAIKKLLFVDTNIWLDFYRTRNEAGIALLSRAEDIAAKIIVTYQLESEFKKNRQAALMEGLQELKPPSAVPRPALFSDAAAVEVINRRVGDVGKRVAKLRAKLIAALEDPTNRDPVYKACQRIFHREDRLVLTRDNPTRRQIRRRAYRRFLHGCPPRKKNDTSFGDAFNWEWMIDCSIDQNAELVIVSRDSDYGVTIDSKSFINDHLRQEFSERVSKKRKLLLYTKLSDALKHFNLPVTKKEEEVESGLHAAGGASERFVVGGQVLVIDGPCRGLKATVTEIGDLFVVADVQFAGGVMGSAEFLPRQLAAL